jgi:hypothetical protein
MNQLGYSAAILDEAEKLEGDTKKVDPVVNTKKLTFK